MDEPTALLPPVSTSSLTELLEKGPMPLSKGLELLGIIAGHVAKLHDKVRPHGHLTSDHVRVQIFESGPPVVIFLDAESTRDTSDGADQLALGTLAFQVLVGRVPQYDESLRDVLTDVPPALDKLVAKLMAPRPADRLTAAGAQRQFLDLAETFAGTRGLKAAAPLAAPPQLKRPVPIGSEHTDARQRSALRQPTPELTDPGQQPVQRPEESNPFADEEATAMVANPRSTAPDPPKPELQGPALEDEPTQFAPVKWNRRQRPTERMEPPLAPPVPTPTPMEEQPETTRDGFEPSRSDLPGHTGDEMTDPRLAARRPSVKRREPAPRSTMTQLIRMARGLPPWAWGAMGVGLAFFVLLLIALAR